MGPNNKNIDEDKLTEAQCDSPATCAPDEKKGLSEDWLALWLGLAIFVISLFTFSGTDLLGWGINTSVWMDPAKAMSPVSKTYQTVKGEITKIDGQKLTLKKADGKEETHHGQGEHCQRSRSGTSTRKSGLSGFTSLLLTYSRHARDHEHRRNAARDRCKEIRDRVHRHFLHQLCLLVRGPLRIHRRHQGQARRHSRSPGP